MSDNLRPLMPQGTAVWLVDNTALTFEQIADFCQLHPLEVEGIANGEVARSIMGVDPVSSNQLTKKQIEECEKDHSRRLSLSQNAVNYIKKHASKKSSRYTPMARRQSKPDGIAWLIENCPEMTDGQICKLLGTTKKTIESIRNKTHSGYSNIKPRDPVLLGLCLQGEMDKVHQLAIKKAEAKRAEEEKLQSVENNTSSDDIDLDSL